MAIARTRARSIVPPHAGVRGPRSARLICAVALFAAVMTACVGSTSHEHTAQPWQRGSALAVDPPLSAGGGSATPSNAGTAGTAARGGAIVAAGRRIPIGVPVVLWTDPGGFDARAKSRPSFAAGRPDPAAPAQRVFDSEGLARAVDQLVLHYDACGTSRRCFDVLQERGLSVHFLLDLDGTLYQTLDLAETAWHARAANERSIGVEIAQIGAYPPGDPTLAQWYVPDTRGVRVALPAGMRGDLRTRAFVARPARPERLRGRIHGELYEQYDFTPQQYETLAHLAAALVRNFPRMKLAAPLDSAGRVRADALDPDELESFGGILGHYHVTRDKTDPGPAFDWARFLARTQRLVLTPAPRP